MKIKEIAAINGPYPPTFEGIRNAIEACRYDQELGENENNDRLLIVREDGSQELVPVGSGPLDEAYEAAEIAHRFGIDHDSGLCQTCVGEDQEELEDFERFVDSLS